MQNIFLVRHGESLANLDLSVYRDTPDHAVALSDKGIRQAHSAGAALLKILPACGVTEADSVRVWRSPYKRARQTAQALKAQLACAYPHLDEREHVNLCEQQFGLFDGIPDQELADRFPLEQAHYIHTCQHEGKFWARMPMGESPFDVAVRVHQAFGTFHRDADRHDVRNIVVVCHGTTLRAFVMQWLHLPYEWFASEPNPGNCDIYRIPCSGADKPGYVWRGRLVE